MMYVMTGMEKRAAKKAPEREALSVKKRRLKARRRKQTDTSSAAAVRTVKKNPIKGTAKRLSDIEFLSSAAMFFLKQTASEEIYRFVGEGLYAMSGNAAVTVNEYGTEEDRLTVKAAYADKELLKQASAILGRKPVGLSFAFGREIRKKIDSGGIVKFEGGLHDLLMGQLPLAPCRRLEEMGLKTVYTMPFSYDNDFLGTIAIIPRSGKLPNIRLIEGFVSQAEIALTRIRAEEALRKSLDELETKVQERTRQLSQAYNRLLFQVDERRKAEKAPKRRTNDLDRRIKEINCLFSAYGIIEKKDVPVGEKLRMIAELIPPAMQHPEAACAKIVLGGKEYATGGYCDTECTIQSDIIIQGQAAGRIEACYLPRNPAVRPLSFLDEERDLVSAVAKKISEMAEYARSEEELARHRNNLEDLVHRRTAELEEANERLRREVEVRIRAEEEKGRLVEELSDYAHVVSHDLKAPLRAISSLATWLATDYTDKFDANGKEQMTLLINRVIRMHNLIEAVLQYSSIGRKGEAQSEVDMNELVADAVEMVSPPFGITVVMEDRLPVLFCNGTALKQVFQNLIENAAKFMDKPEGTIRIGCSSADSQYRFSVADNGPGIEEKHFDRVFKIFQTLHPRDKFESTGVGLSVAKKIVEMYGGAIWLESKVGKGSTFYFTIPKGGQRERK